MTTVDVVCYKYKPLKNKELPLKIKITKGGKTRYINLGVSTKMEYWDFEKNQPKAVCPDKDYLDKLIFSKISEIRSKIVELKSENREFTATTLVEKVSVPLTPLTVGEMFKLHLQSLLEEQRTGYRLSVLQTYNSLLKFNKHLDIYFVDFDINWMKKYENWLRNQGRAENTIGIRFRNIRMIYNLAIEKGIVKQENYPFSKFKVSRLNQKTAKRAISRKDIHSVIDYPLKDKDFYTILSIDLFTFSYYMGGINFVDMVYLTDKNIIDGRLIYNRRKTSKLINLPLQERALVILEKYKKRKNIYLFPILSTIHRTEQQRLNRIHKVITKVNKSLKLIGEELKLPVKLTTYVARHSYATILKRAGVSTSIISESLGHSSEKITQVYLDSFENDAINKALEYL